MSAKHVAVPKPCSSCPFVRGAFVGLCAERITEMCTEADPFHCHKTCDYSEEAWEEDEETGEGRYNHSGKELMCAGWLAFKLKQRESTQMMQIAERLKLWSPRDLDVHSANVYDSIEEMVAGHDV